MPHSYFIKYKEKFKLFFFNALPPHLFYCVHPGITLNSHIDYGQLEKYSKKFLGGAAEWQFAHLECKQLAECIDALHETLIDDAGPKYRTALTVIRSNLSHGGADLIKKIFQLIAKYTDATQEKLRKQIKEFDEKTVIMIATQEIALRDQLVKWVIRQLSADEIRGVIPSLAQPIKLSTLNRKVSQNTTYREQLIHLLVTAKKATNFAGECKLYIQQKADLSKQYDTIGKTYTSGLILEQPAAICASIVNELRQEYILPPLPDELKTEMDEFYKTLHYKLHAGDDPIDTAAWVCIEYGRIHPRENGNGRVSRLLANLILMQRGVFPVIFENNYEYTKKLIASSHNRNQKIFAEFLYNKICCFANSYNFNRSIYSKLYPYISSKLLTRFSLMKSSGQGGGSEGVDYTSDRLELMKTLSGISIHSSKNLDHSMRLLERKISVLKNKAIQAYQASRYERAYQMALKELNQLMQLPICTRQEVWRAYFRVGLALSRLDQPNEALYFLEKADQVAEGQVGMVKSQKERCEEQCLASQNRMTYILAM